MTDEDELPRWHRLSRSGWMAFQQRHDLKPDGMPGLRTLAVVEELEQRAGQRPEFEPPLKFSFGGDPIRRGVNRDPHKLLPGFAAKVEVLFERLRARGFDPLLWEGYRSPRRARKLQELGTGIARSMHCLGAAVDIVDRERRWSPDPGFWRALGDEAERLGLTWGGRWTRPDKPHVQAVAVRDQDRFRAMTDEEREDFVS